MNRLLHSTLANSTTRQYTQAFNQFQRFCNLHQFPVFPLHEDHLMLFATKLSTHSSHSNIKTHLAAIKHYSLLHGYHLTIPPLPRLYMLLRAIKRNTGLHQRKKRLPITITTLRQLATYLQQSSYHHTDKLMLFTAATTAFIGFLRSAEFVSTTTKSFDPAFTLQYSDAIQKDSRIHITIKGSKTDPFRHGCTIRLSPTNTDICPVTTLTKFLATHPTKTGPLFTFTDRSYLTRRRLNKFIRDALPSTQSGYSSHSFRIGAATTAAAAGTPSWLIKQLGRWNSDCFNIYIRIPDSTIDNAMKSLTETPLIGTVWDPYA